MKSNEQEKKKVPAPRLRFKQFEGSGEWKEKKLGEVAVIKGGWAFADKYQGKKEGEILAVKVSDMNLDGNEKYIKSATNYLSRDDIKFMRVGLIELPSIIFAKVGAAMMLNRRRIITYPTMIDNNMMAVAPVTKELSLEYLYYASIFWDFKKFTQEGVVPSINQSQVAKFVIPLPPLPEQTHIAACLSSLDAVIAAHTDKLDALRQHKRALMQQLFPQEGEKVPRLRFPEFEGAGEWEEKKLGLLGHFQGGGTPSKEAAEYWEGDIPWISSSDITEDDIRKISKTRFITEDAIKNSATKKIPVGSVLFVSRVGVGKIAVNSEVICTSQDFTNFTPKDCDAHYVAYYFMAKKDLLVSFGQGMAIKGFTTNDLKGVSFPLPPLPQEQTHIAACLSSLDDLIKAQADKVAGLREFKRGLMQGLFPSTTNHEATE